MADTEIKETSQQPSEATLTNSQDGPEAAQTTNENRNCVEEKPTDVGPAEPVQTGSKLVQPRQRSMLPKPEVGPKPSFIRQSPGRKLPLSSGPSSLNIMTTSLPSPFASPSDSSESSSRSLWGHRGSFSEAMNNTRLSPGSTSSNSSNGSPTKTSPPSPGSKIPVNTLSNTPSGSSPNMLQSTVYDMASKTCSRHCSANIIDVTSTTPRAGNLSKLTAKASGTASMLRSTLRRMTRLAVSTSTQAIATDKQPISQPGTPSPARSPKQEGLLSPSPNTRKILGLGSKSISPPTPGASHIQRSRSFKDAVSYGASTDTWGSRNNGQYGPSSISSVQQYRSNSLRRSNRNKDVQQQQQQTLPPGATQSLRASNGLQRSGTNGTFDRGSNVRRSNSTAGTGGRRLRDQNVRKSRGVQTLLTKDTYLEEDLGLEPVNPSVVEFTVYLPDLLDSGGGADQGVETHVVEPTEPIDVRRNRQLTLDNMRLNRELDKLKTQLSETDAIKRELKSSKLKLEEEQKTRIRIEQQLDQHNEKVLLIARSMDTVEREFEQRDHHIATLESKLAKREAELQAANDVITEQKHKIEQSLILQKTLLMQYQESEIESKELHEFLQAEKYTLAETLKDCESEMSELKSEIDHKNSEILEVEERCGHLVRLGEQRNQEIKMLQVQLKGLEERAKSTILAQGAELSTTHVILTELLSRLRSEYPSDEVIEVAPVKQPGIGLAEKLRNFGRTLISRPEKEVQVEAVEDDLTSGCFLNDPTLQNLSEAIKKRQISEELNNGYPELVSDSDYDEDNPSLDVKLEVLKTFIEKLITDLKNKNNLSHCVCQNGHTSTANGSTKTEVTENGHSEKEQICQNGQNVPNGQNAKNDENGQKDQNGQYVQNGKADVTEDDMCDLNGTLDSKDKKDELISRFLRHRKILMENCEQAEQEIKRVDEIYHETVKHVLKVLDSLPNDTKTHPELVELKMYLQDEENETGGSKKISQNGDFNRTSKSDIIPTSLETVLPGKRQMIHLTETVTPALNQSL